MNPLSNSIPQVNASTAPSDSIVYRPVKPGEIAAALRCVLSSGGKPAADDAIADFMRDAATRGMCLEDLWLAESHGTMVWAVYPVLMPGRTMLMFGAAPAWPQQRPAAQSLVNTICGHFASRNVHLAQVLLDPSDNAGEALYGDCEFMRMAELVYLGLPVPDIAPAPPLPPEWHWESYTPQNHPRYMQTILASYEQSLDCPGLSGMRDIDDIIEGHRATGLSGIQHWQLLCQGPQPLAVLLLSAAGPDVMELVYLGLVPQARGRGLGDVSMRQAMASVRSAGLARLALAVDSGNIPALKLYYRHGMQRLGSRIVMMKDLQKQIAVVS